MRPFSFEIRKQLVGNVIAMVLLVLSFASSLFAQKPEALQHSRRAYELEQSGQKAEALFEYNAAIRIDPTYPYPYTRIGGMYQALRNYPQALNYYHLAVKLDSSFEVYNFFNMGLAYRILQKYDSASLSFQQFLHRIIPVTAFDSASMRDADFWIKFNLGCLVERAKPKNTLDPIKVAVLNSAYDDFGPSITADGQNLYFTSRRASTNKQRYVEGNDYGDDLFVSHRDSAGNWGAPQAIPSPVNSMDDEGTAFITADGLSAYYSLCRRSDGKGECDIYMSEVFGDKWSPPVNLGTPVNSPAWESQPSLTPDGYTMYFSSRRPGSIDGSEDIYVAYKNADGSWIKPINLGEEINTRFNERTPFIAADGKTLYFSSNGHPGFGNHDLFMTKKLEDGTWSVPINLGSPINNVGDDEYLSIPARGDKIYFATQGADAKSNTEIVEAILPDSLRPGPVAVFAGMVYDAKTSEPLGATVEVRELASEDLVAVYRSNPLTGKFFITLGTGKQYGFTATAKDYAFYSANYTIPDTTSYREITYDIPLTRIAGAIASNEKPKKTGTGTDKPGKSGTPSKPTGDPGKPTAGNDKPGTNTEGTKPSGGKQSVIDSNVVAVIPLNNIFFDFNKATLRPESITELKTLVRFLESNPKIRIEVAGHTDSIGTAEVNRKLSQERAEAVQAYLTQHGIPASRTRAKGYGATQQLDWNDTEEQRQKNRRTEFKILK
jgi:outer membrane protein OmpA-like peptidoglycan-associated protein